MAHLVETMAYAGEVPWHGLGTKVPADLSPEQMLEKAGLNWTVEKKPLFFMNNDQRMPVGNSNALVRSSDQRSLTVVSNDWNPVQNHEAFSFFDDFVKAGDMQMHTAGSLKGGQIVWALAKVSDSFELFGGDQVDSFLLFTNPHEFGRSIDVRFTPIRVVCNNTLTFSLNSNSVNHVRINHRNQFDAEDVKNMLGVAHHKLDEYKNIASFLGSKKTSKESIVEYFNRVFPSMSYNLKADEKQKMMSKEAMSRQAKEAVRTLETQPGSRFAKGSWWHAFNTVTYLTDHKLGRSADARLTSAWYGSNKNKKDKALELAIEYAEAA